MQYTASCNVYDELYDLLLKLIVCDKEAWCPYTSFVYEGSVLVNISRSILLKRKVMLIIVKWFVNKVLEN